MIKFASILAISLAPLATLYSQEAVPAKAPQIVILKLDDLTTKDADASGVSTRWQQIANFVEKKKIKASVGIIANSLDADKPAFFEWIKAQNKKGLLEFWNHGQTHSEKLVDGKKIHEFKNVPFEEQKATLEKSQKLAKEKLGFDFAAIGTPFNTCSEDTEKVLEEFPEIKVWFFGPAKPKFSKKLILERTVDLEKPVLNPDFEQFKTAYEKLAVDKEYIVLQGHPMGWKGERFKNFESAVDYLLAKGCVFMTPSEYFTYKEKKK